MAAQCLNACIRQLIGREIQHSKLRQHCSYCLRVQRLGRGVCQRVPAQVKGQQRASVLRSLPKQLQQPCCSCVSHHASKQGHMLHVEAGP